jgi:excisionase family DNA binding protein
MLLMGFERHFVILGLVQASYPEWKPSHVFFMPSRFLTVKELAALLNLRESWIYDRTSGHGPEVIPHTRFGRQVRFNIASPEFNAWLKSHGVSTAPEALTSLTA